MSLYEMVMLSCHYSAKSQYDDYVDQKQNVDLLFNLRLFEVVSSLVHYDLCFLACVKNQSSNFIRILNERPLFNIKHLKVIYTVQKLFNFNVLILFRVLAPILIAYSAPEVVQIAIGWWTKHFKLISFPAFNNRFQALLNALYG